MSIQLPVVLQPAITTHCDIYNHLCVAALQKENCDRWLLTNFRLGLSKNYSLQFVQKKQIKDIYAPILHNVERNLLFFENTGKVIPYIESCLTDGKYIIFRRIINLQSKELLFNDNLEEIPVLIYGFESSEKVFYSVMMHGVSHRMLTCEISYEIIEESIEKMSSDRAQETKSVNRTLLWELTLSGKALSPVSAVDMKEELELEWTGEIEGYIYLNNSGKRIRPISCGLPAFRGFIDYLYAVQAGREEMNPVELTRSLGRLYEYYRLYLNRIRSALDAKSFDKIASAYQSCVRSLYNCYALSYKAVASNDPNALDRVVKYLDRAYETQCRMLNKTRNK